MGFGNVLCWAKQIPEEGLAMRRKYRFGLVAMIALSVASCAPTIYGRTDGGPVNTRQFENDKTICQGEVARADNGSLLSPTDDDAVFAGCMAQRGYLKAR